MTRRLVGIDASSVARPNSDFPPRALRAAMVEDVYEMVAGLELVEPVLIVATDEPEAQGLTDITWPGTRVLPVARGATSVALLGHLAGLGAEVAALVAGDAPDLPPLLVGKLFRGLGAADVALLPARGGGLVALAARCPVPQWLSESGAGLDVAEAAELARQASPRRSALSVGPGWHRVRQPHDVPALDPGLEGWEITAAALRAPGSDAPAG